MIFGYQLHLRENNEYREFRATKRFSRKRNKASVCDPFFCSAVSRQAQPSYALQIPFYADGHYYQKFQETITEFPYLHIEGSPQPLHFNELIHSMLGEGAIEVQPQITEEEREGKKFTVLRGDEF